MAGELNLELLNPDLLSRLNDANRAWREKTGRDLPITSGARTAEQQNDLRRRAAAGERGIFMPAPVPPGATHVHTNAVDISTEVPTSFLQQFGLARPLGEKDPVHVTLAGGKMAKDKALTDENFFPDDIPSSAPPKANAPTTPAAPQAAALTDANFFPEDAATPIAPGEAAPNGALRGLGLSLRAMGPYAASSGLGAVMAAPLGPQMIPVGAVAGPVALGLTDLGVSAYNGVNSLLDMAGLPSAQRAPTGTELIDVLMDKAGIPRPQSTTENVVQNVTRVGLNAPTAALNAGNVAGGLNPGVAKEVFTQMSKQPGAQMGGAVAGTTLATTAAPTLSKFLGPNPDRSFLPNEDLSAVPTMALDMLGNMVGGGITSRASNLNMGTIPKFVPKIGGEPVNPLANYNFNETLNPTTKQPLYRGADINAARNEGLNLSAAEVDPTSVGGRTIRVFRNMGGTADTRANALAEDTASFVQNRNEANRPANVPPDLASNAGADRAVATDLRKQYSAAKTAVRPLFEQAAKLAGNNPIPTKNAAQAALDATDLISSIDNSAVRGTLTKIFDATAKGGMTYRNIRNLQSDLFAVTSQVRKGLGTGQFNERQLAALDKVYGGLADDVNSWAAPRNVNGKPVYTPAGAAHVRAMDQFKETVAPFRDDSLIYSTVSKKGPRSAEYDSPSQKLTERLLSSGPETTNLATTLMSPEGNAAFRFAIGNKATNAATTPDAATPFSAPAFQRGMNLGNGDTVNASVIATDPTALAKAQQTQRIIDMARGTTADAGKSTPKTGARLVPYANTAFFGGAGSALANALAPESNMAGLIMGGLAGNFVGPKLMQLGDATLSSTGATNFMLGRGYNGAMGLLNAANNEVSAPSLPMLPEVVVTGSREDSPKRKRK